MENQLVVHSPFVAIVMRSKNEFPYIETTLKSLKEQTYQNYNLYHIDSGSSDGTFEIIQQYSLSPKNIFQIAPENYIPGKVLNNMIEKTLEEIIVLLNADAIPINKFWLEQLLLPILNNYADVTMSRQQARHSAYFIVCYDYLRGYHPKNIQKLPQNFFSAVACAFKKELWLETKFYEEGYSEDSVWAAQVCSQKKARFIFVPDSIVEHSHNYSLRELYRKRYRHGIAATYLYQTNPSLFLQLFSWSKELLRDLLYALKKLKWYTIPYNIFYRTTIHLAFYSGKKEGQKKYYLKKGRK